jgi:multicomponent Na+:H+ antiporter subunit C
MDFQLLLANYPYVFSVLLFSMGWLIMLTQSNLIKKVIGINIMENGIFLFYLALGQIHGSQAPLFDPDKTDALYANPLPGAIILTGIVVSFCITSLALSIIIKIYGHYGTIYAHRLLRVME